MQSYDALHHFNIFEKYYKTIHEKLNKSITQETRNKNAVESIVPHFPQHIYSKNNLWEIQRKYIIQMYHIRQKVTAIFCAWC